MIIGLSGKKQSGKDTVCKIIQDLTSNNYANNSIDSIGRRVVENNRMYNSSWLKKAICR